MGESHICGNSANIGDEECSLTAALQLLYCRMLSSQPEFFEEDVGFTEYPLAGNPLTHSPTHSPTHMTHTSSHWGDAQGESDETGASSLFSRVAVCSPQTLSASSEQNVAPPTTTVPDLDPPITCQRFFEVVKNFDAKMILRSRKVALDTLKLLSCAYALAWRDACELPRFTQSNRGASSRAMTSVLRAEGVNSGSNTMLSTSQPLFGVPSASTSLHKPEEGIVRLMDKCIGCLLVYANESAALRNVVASNTALLKLLCFVCVEARKLEVASHRSVVRDLQSEFSNFTSYWGSFAATQSLLETLQECYLVEFLLDAALPPTVCSGKYDGIAKTLFQRRGGWFLTCLLVV
uniref:Uncharacterized protein TCIL3000_11_16880 n=1 Tax=Trypanosoma congolense (strain IL3000) TaxID=1068625 RepID=G0V3F1_TRYCI|nr:unnamed protein product [Trypanosoma congolense IL3000]